MEPKTGALGIAIAATRKLIATQDLAPSSIEVLVVVSQNPDRNIPHMSAEIHGAIGMSSNCACFDIGLGCSGFVYGLAAISSFMKSSGFSRGILVSADPYSKIVDENDKSTSLIFGDAATATLLDKNAVFDLGQFSFGTLGKEAHNLTCDNGLLKMNGRGVFNFAVSRIPDDIRIVAEKNNISLESIDLFILHQGSKYIVETIADRLEIPREKVPFSAGDYGNTVSSSIPIILANSLTETAHKTIALSGFGLGLSWASTILKRRAES